MTDEKLTNKRAALYIRVSSEEQALKGYSLEAQLSDLESFAKEHYMLVADRYIDAGTTARKSLHKRKEFQRMLEDIEANKIDVILFIKLDRWFRNVADYYEVQKVLDAHSVVWKCTQEFYDTTTANGRLNLNIKLSIAQDEADRTSERIKFVQENKVKNGEVISGSLPYGLYIDRTGARKTIAIDKDKIGVTLDAFNYFLACHSRRKTRIYIGDKYGLRWTDQTFKAMIFNDLYAGEYRENTEYCEAAVDKSMLLEMRRICKELHQHSRTGVHCYLFSGLVRCSLCKNAMHGVADKLKSGEYTYYYRCSQHYNRHSCVNNKSIKEEYIEEYLFQNVDRLISAHLAEFKIAEKQNTQPQAQKSKIKSKLRKLKDLYVNDLIDMKDYKKDYEHYTRQLEQIEEVKMPTSANIGNLQRFIDRDFKSIYYDLEREERRTLWRSVIKDIFITENKEILPPVFL